MFPAKVNGFALDDLSGKPVLQSRFACQCFMSSALRFNFPSFPALLCLNRVSLVNVSCHRRSDSISRLSLLYSALPSRPYIPFLAFFSPAALHCIVSSRNFPFRFLPRIFRSPSRSGNAMLSKSVPFPNAKTPPFTPKKRVKILYFCFFTHLFQ